jgi:3-dehydroquinate synthase
MKELMVGLGDRSYPIKIGQGLLDEIGRELHRNPFAKRYGIIADDRVASLFGEKLLTSLKDSDIDVELITFKAGEENKNLATVAELSSKLARLGFDRKDGLLALGGGVTGDITGFVAACYMRSIPFAQIPTTLLSQVDSSVGGKTGVDIPEGKNLVGAFYQPKAVYIDSKVLTELPKNELLSGLAEVIKYGVIYDKDFFKFLEINSQNILSLNLQVLEEIIAWCCKIKAAIVEADEKESDFRRILNFGHTIGHAVEAASEYKLSHGFAVAMGMAAASEISVLNGILNNRELERIINLIKELGLPVSIPQEYKRTSIKQYLLTDKKIVGGKVFFVLPTKIGKVLITDDVREDIITKVLQ